MSYTVGNCDDKNKTVNKDSVYLIKTYVYCPEPQKNRFLSTPGNWIMTLTYFLVPASYLIVYYIAGYSLRKISVRFCKQVLIDITHTIKDYTVEELQNTNRPREVIETRIKIHIEKLRQRALTEMDKEATFFGAGRIWES